MSLCSNQICIQPSVVKFKHYVTHGYRCCPSCGKTHNFCSEKCLNKFQRTQCCYKCNESGQNCTYINEAKYASCHDRGDLEVPCIILYQIKQRLVTDLTRIGYVSCLTGNLEEWFEDILVSTEVLRDLYFAEKHHKLRIRNPKTTPLTWYCDHVSTDFHYFNDGESDEYLICADCSDDTDQFAEITLNTPIPSCADIIESVTLTVTIN